MANEELRTNNEGVVEAVDAVVTNLPTKSNVGTIAKICRKTQEEGLCDLQE